MAFKPVLTVTTLLLSVFACNLTQAQTACGYKHRTAEKTTIADAAEDNYDVKYVKLDLQLTNTSTYINGHVTTRAKVTASSMSAYVFELSGLLTIDSAFVNGNRVTVGGSGDVRTASLATSVGYDSTLVADVYYHGSPISGTLFTGATGFNNIASPSWGNAATFNLSESQMAYQWWPCKQSLRDKIDSSEVWITVPDSLKAGSNGRLQRVVSSGGFARYEWKEKHPIDYYLISVAVANYVDYSFYAHLTGSSDSILVQNYIYSNPRTLPNFKRVLDSTALMLDYFSQLYGRYPFADEKYGHCMAPLSGGMEHQTMSTMGFFDGSIVAHELGHQWFGNNVTCGTWSDIMINEGFASYSEYLFKDRFQGHANAINDIRGRHSNVTSVPNGSIFVTDTTNDGIIFDSRLSYDKGACVVHMLRYLVNSDTIFFNTLRQFQTTFAGSNATIVDLQNTTASVAGATLSGIPLDTFFTQWIYKEGFPSYGVTWKQTGNDIYVHIIQNASVPASVNVFKMPLELKFSSAAGDTTVKVLNDAAGQWYHFTWSKTANSLAFDPNYWLLCRYSVTKDPLLSVAELDGQTVSVVPNPANASWQLSGLVAGSTVRLLNMQGQLLWQQPASTATLSVPATELATGVYLLQIATEGGTRTMRVIKE